ncbi:MAG: hypothetical protein ACPGNV_07395 [Mangrovicoccus sp.]
MLSQQDIDDFQDPGTPCVEKELRTSLPQYTPCAGARVVTATTSLQLAMIKRWQNCFFDRTV